MTLTTIDNIFNCQLPTANCQLPTANCQLPTANCQLPTANCQLPTANCQLPTANCQLPTANCQLPTANCQLPTANCQLPTANCFLCENHPFPTRIIDYFSLDLFIKIIILKYYKHLRFLGKGDVALYILWDMEDGVGSFLNGF